MRAIKKQNRRHPSLDDELKSYAGLEKRQMTNTSYASPPVTLGTTQEPLPIFGDLCQSQLDLDQGK